MLNTVSSRLFLLAGRAFFWQVRRWRGKDRTPGSTVPLVHHFNHFLFLLSTKTVLIKMRVGLTYSFDFLFENHASQVVSTENFPFWVQDNGPVLENGIVFEKIVNLSKNFQKLFLQQSMLNEHETYPSRRATSDRRQWKIAPGLKRVGGNGKLPLV